jgi:hypothetical protein
MKLYSAAAYALFAATPTTATPTTATIPIQQRGLRGLPQRNLDIWGEPVTTTNSNTDGIWDTNADPRPSSGNWDIWINRLSVPALLRSSGSGSSSFGITQSEFQICATSMHNANAWMSLKPVGPSCPTYDVAMTMQAPAINAFLSSLPSGFGEEVAKKCKRVAANEVAPQQIANDLASRAGANGGNNNGDFVNAMWGKGPSPTPAPTGPKKVLQFCNGWKFLCFEDDPQCVSNSASKCAGLETGQIRHDPRSPGRMNPYDRSAADSSTWLCYGNDRTDGGEPLGQKPNCYPEPATCSAACSAEVEVCCKPHISGRNRVCNVNAAGNACTCPNAPDQSGACRVIRQD